MKASQGINAWFLPGENYTYHKNHVNIFRVEVSHLL